MRRPEKSSIRLTVDVELTNSTRDNYRETNKSAPIFLWATSPVDARYNNETGSGV
jgi:hypothetical protein